MAAFSASIESGDKATITLIGNSFSQNSSTLMTLVTNAFFSYEKMIVSNRLEQTGTDPNLLQPFVIEQKEISEDDIGSNLLAMMVPLMLVLAIGIGAAPSAYDLFAGEKEKKTMEALLMTPVNRSTLLLSKWLSITSIGVLTGIITLLVVIVEIAFFTENLKSGLSFGENIWLIVLFSLLVIIVFSMFNAALLMLTSIVAKTVKEAQSYSTPIMMLAVFPTMIISSIGVNEFAFYHFAIPIMNIFSILKELLFGVINYEHILIMVLSNLAAVIIIFIFSRILFLKDKWVMS
ncbi:ABC transporter permease subunit [Caldifermentibacillus hisashii]|uniref:ABC transporter permease n=2 Tax=Caldifermentibacillus hisashii TaxID=996558 RepID=UPI00343D0F78